MGEEQQTEVSLGRRHIIERPRLTQLLDETSARVIMLVAPAGYGKTTLARQWLANRPHAWYQATPASADIAALALGIVGSTADLIPHAGRHHREWLPTSPEPESEIDVIADLLLDELKALPRDSWLVLDDVHLLASEASETMLRLVIESGTSPILITGRIRPPWVSARDLLYGRYFELGHSTLAMTFDETNAILKSADSEAAHGLIALADGWPAVIGLAALSPTPVNFAQDVPQTLHDYFAEEIYNALDLSVRETLSCLAIHRTVTRDFAEAVMGSEAIDAIGCGISAGLFPVSSRADLEFHPLLHPFFRTRFHELPQERIDTTLTRAIEVLIDKRAWDDAFWLIEEFQQFDLLDPFLAKALEPLTQEGRLSTLRAWLAFGRKHRPDSPYVDLLDAELSFRGGLHHRAGLLACRSAAGFIADEPLQSLAYYRAGQCKHFTSAPREALALFQKASDTARTVGRVRDALWG